MTHQNVDTPDCNHNMQSMTIPMVCTVPLVGGRDTETNKLYLKQKSLPTQKKKKCATVYDVSNAFLLSDELKNDATIIFIRLVLAFGRTGKHWSLSVCHVSQLSEQSFGTRC